jgi:hypothetical protein
MKNIDLCLMDAVSLHNYLKSRPLAFICFQKYWMDNLHTSMEAMLMKNLIIVMVKVASFC